MKSLQSKSLFVLALLACSFVLVQSASAQPGRGGGGGAGRSPGNAGGNRGVAGGANRGPAMSRPPSGKPGGGGPNLGGPGPGAGGNRVGGPGGPGGPPNARPDLGAGANGPKPGASGFTRPSSKPGGNAGIGDRTGPGDRPGDRPSDRPGAENRPNAENFRPSAGVSSAQLDDFLGHRGTGDLANKDQLNDRISGRPGVDNRDISNRDFSAENFNAKRSSYTDNRQAWLDEQHVNGDEIRANAGDRYYDSYRNGYYRRGYTGGYYYYNSWGVHGAWYGWQTPNYAAMNAFLGASWANSQPVYYGYGTGGNVYYEDNTVYVDGQASGTPEEYAQQAIEYAQAAPAPTEASKDEEWLPLGVFALSSEETHDSQVMIELAVNKQGVLAGTYYNEATDKSRPLKGTVDQKSQRAVVGFADGSNPDYALETGIYNLTKDEAPGLIHQGKSDSKPVLLVRLPPPKDDK